MGFYDIVMIVVLVGAIWFGYWKGLAWQIASLAAIIVSYIVSVNFRDPVAGFIQAGEPWNRIGAMLVLFIGTSLVIWTIYGMVSKSLKKNELKGFDRQMGALLGALKGGLLCIVLTMFAVSLMGETAHDAVHESKLGPYVEKGIWNASRFVPAEIAKFVDPHLQNYQEASKHGEPIVNPGADFQNILNGGGGGGSSYPANPNQQYTNDGYQGRLVYPQDQPQTNTQNQFGFGGSQQPAQQSWTPPQTQTQAQTQAQTQTQTALNQFSDMDISAVSKQILQELQQAGKQAGWEAIRAEAERRLKNALPPQQR